MIDTIRSPGLRVTSATTLAPEICKFKGTFRLTKTGKSLVGRPAEIFASVAEPYLFDVIHSSLPADTENMDLAWPIIMNLLNIETHAGVMLKRAAELIFLKRMRHGRTTHVPLKSIAAFYGRFVPRLSPPSSDPRFPLALLALALAEVSALLRSSAPTNRALPPWTIRLQVSPRR